MSELLGQATNNHRETLVDSLFLWLVSPESRDTSPASFLSACEEGKVTESELLATFSFCTLAAKLEEALQPKLDLLRKIAEIPEDFSPFEKVTSSDLSRKVQGVRELLNCPPPEIVSAVADVVIGYQLGKRTQRRTPLRGLQVASFQHPVDRALLGTLNAVPGMQKMISTIVSVQSGNAEVAILGMGFRVRPHGGMSGLYDCFQEACDALDVHPPPRLYVEQGPIGTRSLGLKTPSVVVSSATLSLLTRDELLFAFGHELGHIKAGHLVYQAVVEVVRNSGDLLSDFTLGLSKLIEGATLTPLLSTWIRRSELTADRAGFLVCQNRDVALRTLAKFAGFPPSLYRQLHPAAIVEQVEEFCDVMSGSFQSRIYGLNQLWNAVQPFPIIRAYELLDWLQDGVAQELLDSTPNQRQQIHQWASEDPALADFIQVLIRTLSNWVAHRLNLSPKLCRRILRGVLLEKRSAKETPLSQIMQIALNIDKLNSGSANFTARLLFNEKGKALKIVIPIFEFLPWDEVPKQYREDFIRGGQSHLEYMLYAV